MEIEILAIAYLEKKEQALAERAKIDLELKAALTEAEKDKSALGRQKTDEIKANIGACETAFEQTVKEIGPIFNELYPILEEMGSCKDNPFSVSHMGKIYGFYIDDNKNIHYQ